MLKKIGKIACFLLLVLTPISLQAQGIIKGRVVAKIDTEPLIGVTVILLELKKAVSTDVDGFFIRGVLILYFLSYTRVSFISRSCMVMEDSTTNVPAFSL